MIWLYTKPGCQPCAIAKALLEQQNKSFKQIEAIDPLLVQRFTQLFGQVITPMLFDDQRREFYGLTNVGAGAQWMRVKAKEEV